MYEWNKSDLFWKDSVHKEIYIQVVENEDIVLTNEDIYEESLSLDQGISSGGTLKAGTCISNTLRFDTGYLDNLVGYTLAVWMGLDGDTENVLPLGVFVVSECNWDSERTKRSIVAYDYMYDIINTDCTDWYQTYYEEKGETTGVYWNTFLEDFLDQFGLVCANKGMTDIYHYFDFYATTTEITVQEYLDYERTELIEEAVFDQNGGSFSNGRFKFRCVPSQYGYVTWYYQKKGNGYETSMYVYETQTEPYHQTEYYDLSPLPDVYSAAPTSSKVFKGIGDNQQILGQTILSALLEVAGLFGWINRFGEFQLMQIAGPSDTSSAYHLYPGAFYPYYTETLTESGSATRYSYPGGPSSDIISVVIDPSKYETVEYADFEVLPADLAISFNESNEVVSYSAGMLPSGKWISDINEAENPYYLMNNWLIYGDHGSEVVSMYNLLVNMSNSYYRPCSLKMMGNPCLEPGDRIEVIVPARHNREELRFETLILQRSLSGIQTLKDTITADGTKYFGKPDLSVNSRLSNIERQLYSGTAGGGGGITVLSVEELPMNPDYNIIYLIQGDVVVR